MSVFFTSLRRAKHASSRTHVRYVGGATILAFAATVSAGTISTFEPANAEAPRVTHASGATWAEGDVSSSTPAFPAKPVSQPADAPAPAPVPAAKPVMQETPATFIYADNLDGWIRRSLQILEDNKIPASYDGIMRNIMRESTGNPKAINLYDSNAAKGIPSKGLLQVIDPTFAAYHVPGTPFDIWNPVSNIVAACNYAAHNYGSIDNVNGAY